MASMAWRLLVGTWPMVTWCAASLFWPVAPGSESKMEGGT